MRITCNRCDTNYDVPDERLGSGAVKIRCSQCGHLFVVRRRPAKAAEPEREPPVEESPREARFEDFDFRSFETAAEPEPALRDAAVAEPAEPLEPPQGGELADLLEGAGDHLGEPTDLVGESQATVGKAADLAGEPEGLLGQPGGVDDEPRPSLGELDLGDFDDLGGELDLRGEDLHLDDEAFPEELEAPLERVSEEELVSGRKGDAPSPSLAEKEPRLDIQRGPRRPEAVTPSPLVARDRRRSPLFWIVLLAAAGTAIFTGYNIYKHPDKALTFLNPSKIRALWRMRQMEAHFGVEGLRGYYKDLSADRNVFVIRGDVANRSTGPRSLIRVKGNLFGPDGRTLATREVYCGNVLTEMELATLPIETIEARLQNEVGQTLSNVDISPGSRVPFMVVFPSPPEGVEKFNVTVTEARAGSGS